MDEQTNFTREHADDGINEKIEFNEYRCPAYWMRRRAIHAFMHNVAPFGIVLLTLLAFFIMGFIEVCL